MAVTRIKNNQITDSTITFQKIAPGTLVGSLFNANLTLNSNISITGNLTVAGNTTTINSIDTLVTDSLITLNSGYVGLPSYDVGVLFNRALGTLSNYGSVNSALVWSESEEAFVVVLTTETGATQGIINKSFYANIKAGNITTANRLSAESATITNLDVANSVFNSIISTGNIVAASGTNATNYTTGALVVPGGGGVGITGDLWVQGPSTFAGNIIAGNIQLSGNINVPVGGTFSNTGVFFGNASGIGALYAGTTTYTALPTTVLQLSANVDTYAQLNFQNINSGTKASTDLVLTADNGNDTDGFIDLGINSSTFADPAYPGFYPNDGYLVHHSALSTGNLVIFSHADNSAIKLHIGDYGDANTKVTVTSTGLKVNTQTSSTSTTSGALIVDGGLGVAGNIHAAAINNTAIGNTSPSTGKFTNLEAATLVGTNLSSGNAQITGGTILGLTNLSATTGVIDNFSSGNAQITGGTLSGLTDISVTTLVSTNFSTANAQVTGGTLSGLTNVSATTLVGTNLSTSNAQVTGGNISGVVLQANDFSTANAQITGGSFVDITSLSAGTGVINNFSTGNALITGGNISGVTAQIPNLSSANALITGGNISGVTAQVTNFSSGNAQITGGDISGVTAQVDDFSTANAQITGGDISGVTAQVDDFSTANAQITGGTLIGLTQISSVTGVIDDFNSANAIITGGYADNFPIGSNVSAAGKFTNIIGSSATIFRANSTNGNITNLDSNVSTVFKLNVTEANIGSFVITNGSINTLYTGNLSTGNARITGGYADNFPIGANIASTGSFTTIIADDIYADTITVVALNVTNSNVNQSNVISTTTALLNTSSANITIGTAGNLFVSNLSTGNAYITGGNIDILSTSLPYSTYVKADFIESYFANATTASYIDTSVSGNLFATGATFINLSAPNILISSGSIDGTTIGLTTPANASFITANATTFTGFELNSTKANITTGNAITFTSNTLNATTANITSVTISNLALITSGIESDSTGTGAIVVQGGIGLTGNINIGGNAVIGGNLLVQGDLISFNVSELIVEDKNIVIASGASTPLAADGAGITVDGANATLSYNNYYDGWEFNKVVVAPSVNLMNGNIVTLVADNFSSANAQITGGLISGATELSVTTGVITNFSSGNVLITDGDISGVVLTADYIASGNVQITGGNILSMIVVDGYYGIFNDLQSTNVIITGGYINNLDNVSASYATINNFNSANAYIFNGYLNGVIGANTAASGSFTNVSANSLDYINGNSITSYVYNLNVTNANINQITVPTLTITDASISNVLIGSGNVATLYVNSLNSSDANISNVSAINSTAFNLNSTNGNITNLLNDYLTVTDASISNLLVSTGNVTTLTVYKVNTSEANATLVNANTVTTYALNGTNGNITNLLNTSLTVTDASVSNLLVSTGNVSTLTVYEVNVSEANVTSINANTITAYKLNNSEANVTVGTFSGNLLANTIWMYTGGTIGNLSTPVNQYDAVNKDYVDTAFGNLDFTFISNGSANVHTINDGGSGTINANGNVVITSTTESTSTASGALQVYGGVGIDKNLNVGGNISALAGIFTSIYATQWANVNALQVNNQTVTATLNASGNVYLAPTLGAATVTINPLVIGSMDNMSIGQTLAANVYSTNFRASQSINASTSGGIYLRAGAPNSSSIQNISIGTVEPRLGVFTDLYSDNLQTNVNASIGTLVSTNFSTSNAQITGGSISGIVNLTTVNLNVTSGNLITANVNNLEAVGINATSSNISSAAITTLAASNFSSGNARVTGGYADNFPIGANTAAPGKFTTGTFTSLLSNGNIVITNGNTTNYTASATVANTDGAIVITGTGGAAISGNLYVGQGTVINGSKSTHDTIIRGVIDNSLLYIVADTNYDQVSVGANIVAANVIQGAKLAVNSTDSILIPVGTTAQRPSGSGFTDVDGMIRFNNTTNQLEYYGGGQWNNTGATFTIITSRVFSSQTGDPYGNVDGVNTNFTLTANSTTSATLVSINGVMQIPTTSYTVSNDVLTFTEAPAIGDVIDSRVLVTSTTVDSLADTTGFNAFIADTNGLAFNTGNVLLGSVEHWRVNTGGDLIPITSANIGNPAYSVDYLYVSNVVVTGGTITGATVGGGSLDNTVIGANIAALGSFTNLYANAPFQANAGVVANDTSNLWIESGLTGRVYSFDKTIYRTGKFIVQLSDESNGEYQSAEIMAIHNDTVCSIETFAVTYTGAANLATFSCNVVSNTINLNASSAGANLIVKVFPTLVKK